MKIIKTSPNECRENKVKNTEKQFFCVGKCKMMCQHIQRNNAGNQYDYLHDYESLRNRKKKIKRKKQIEDRRNMNCKMRHILTAFTGGERYKAVLHIVKHLGKYSEVIVMPRFFQRKLFVPGSSTKSFIQSFLRLFQKETDFSVLR